MICLRTKFHIPSSSVAFKPNAKEDFSQCRHVIILHSASNYLDERCILYYDRLPHMFIKTYIVHIYKHGGESLRLYV
jgi:hypothetical protein